MTTSPNSSASAWRAGVKDRWIRWVLLDMVVANRDGTWTYETCNGETMFRGKASRASYVAAMEAADLAIAEMERKG